MLEALSDAVQNIEQRVDTVEQLIGPDAEPIQKRNRQKAQQPPPPRSMLSILQQLTRLIESGVEDAPMKRARHEVLAVSAAPPPVAPAVSAYQASIVPPLTVPAVQAIPAAGVSAGPAGVSLVDIQQVAMLFNMLKQMNTK